MYPTHRKHSVGDEGVVPEALEERKRLVDGIGDLHLLTHEVLKKSLFQGRWHNEHPAGGCLSGTEKPRVRGVCPAALGMAQPLKTGR